tara:strand:- start:874 stop:1377 length:504 start_codon:yes stop_codon:yes gene_type:complete
MNDKQRLQLKQMIKDNDVEDQTQKIRAIKHSGLIKKDVVMMQMLKSKHSDIRANDPNKFSELCMFHSDFLYKNYTDIYIKLKNDELDLQIFNKFLDVLERIENEELDQHEGSFEIGNLLKKLYVDSALRKAAVADALNSNTQSNDLHEVNQPVNISWKEFKTMSPNK